MILPNIVVGMGSVRCHALRLRRGDDLMLALRALCREKGIRSGVVLSGVGCVYQARIRDAGGKNIHTLPEHFEIVSLNGTVSANRCHVHIALSREDLSTIGGHLCEGCLINTTCELVVLELPGIAIESEFDHQTGYDELIFTPNA